MMIWNINIPNCFRLIIRIQSAAVTSKVCFVKYRESQSVQVARHLSNTVFIDRAMIVIPASDGNF